MKRLVFLLFVIGAFTACKKNSSPKKVDRLIVGEEWSLEKWITQNVNRTEEFKNFTYKFNKEKEFISKGPDSTVIGSWDTADAKNPAVLILSISEMAQDALLGDDWNIIYLSKDEFRLERLNQNSSANDECIFKRL